MFLPVAGQVSSFLGFLRLFKKGGHNFDRNLFFESTSVGCYLRTHHFWKFCQTAYIFHLLLTSSAWSSPWTSFFPSFSFADSYFFSTSTIYFSRSALCLDFNCVGLSIFFVVHDCIFWLLCRLKFVPRRSCFWPPLWFHATSRNGCWLSLPLMQFEWVLLLNRQMILKKFLRINSHVLCVNVLITLSFSGGISLSNVYY